MWNFSNLEKVLQRNQRTGRARECILEHLEVQILKIYLLGINYGGIFVCLTLCTGQPKKTLDMSLLYEIYRKPGILGAYLWIKHKIQTHKQEIFRPGEVSWNEGTLINTLLTTSSQICISNETQAQYFSWNQGTFFNLQKKAIKALPPKPQSNIVTSLQTWHKLPFKTT